MNIVWTSISFWKDLLAIAFHYIPPIFAFLTWQWKCVNLNANTSTFLALRLLQHKAILHSNQTLIIILGASFFRNEDLSSSLMHVTVGGAVWEAWISVYWVLLHQLHKKWLIILQIAIWCKMYISLRSTSFTWNSSFHGEYLMTLYIIFTVQLALQQQICIYNKWTSRPMKYAKSQNDTFVTKNITRSYHFLFLNNQIYFLILMVGRYSKYMNWN